VCEGNRCEIQGASLREYLPTVATIIRIMLIAAAVAVAACDHKQETLSDRIDSVVRKKGELNLGEVTDFPWDRVVIFGPYSDRRKHICPNLRSVWPNCEAEALEPLWEADMYLVFISNGAVIRGEMHKAKYGDFCPDSCSAQGIPRAAAIFSARPVRKTLFGKQVYALSPREPLPK
jgi:hypothetical protein